MSMFKKFGSLLAAAALASGVAYARGGAQRPQEVQVAVARPDAKALSGEVGRGLTWLAAHQLDNGAWGQGDEAPTMGGGGQLRDTPSVADTAMAVLAFMRAGQNASHGEHAAQVKRGLNYILSEVESSDDKSLYVTQTRGTRVQYKIGTYVDTFAALMVLTEAKGTMPDDAGNQRIGKAIDKVVAKIKNNQRQDGTWDNKGWAPALTQSMAAKGLNRAAQSGTQVDEATLRRVEAQAQGAFDAKSGGFATGEAAGVGLYSAAAPTSAMQDSLNTRKKEEVELREKMAAAKTPAERDGYAAKIADNQKAQGQTENAEKALIAKLDDPAFIRGFGNNGGEEFLSYMLVSEALASKGGAEWKTWDASITKLVDGVQNQDGSWTGHHCITGRTFCTAAALLVLMADRAPVPTASGLHG
jgi:hypothetical protein